jgi:hypothetical protein
VRVAVYHGREDVPIGLGAMFAMGQMSLESVFVAQSTERI